MREEVKFTMGVPHPHSVAVILEKLSISQLLIQHCPTVHESGQSLVEGQPVPHTE